MPETAVAIRRIFDAPREQVWKAWTEPAQLARWWGRRGWNAQLEGIVMEVRPGGRFHVPTFTADGREMTTDGIYVEVTAPERIVFDEDGTTGTVTFTDLGDGRTEMVFTTITRSAAAEAGLNSAFDRLAQTLEATT